MNSRGTASQIMAAFAANFDSSQLGEEHVARAFGSRTRTAAGASGAAWLGPFGGAGRLGVAQRHGRGRGIAGVAGMREQSRDPRRRGAIGGRPDLGQRRCLDGRGA